MEVQLRRLGSNSKIRVLKIPKDCRTKIWLAGRGTSCQIYTKSKYASRQHFSITYKEQKYFISDLQSANGTFLNDEKLTSEKVLTFGSIISVGVPSEMQNSAECIVYAFEPCSAPFSVEKEAKESNISKNNETVPVVEPIKKPSPEPPPSLEEVINMEVDSPPITAPEPVNEPMDVDIENNENIDQNNSSSSDIIIIEPPVELGPKPKKIRRLEPTSSIKIKKEKIEEVRNENTQGEITSEENKNEEVKEKSSRGKGEQDVELQKPQEKEKTPRKNKTEKTKEKSLRHKAQQEIISEKPEEKTPKKNKAEKMKEKTSRDRSEKETPKKSVQEKGDEVQEKSEEKHIFKKPQEKQPIKKIQDKVMEENLNKETQEKRHEKASTKEAREIRTDDDQDAFAYEALTQVDEPDVKTEPDLLNYSLTEELIELSDSEEDWIPTVKPEGNKSPEGEDEDDDIVVLETIIKSKQSDDFDIQSKMGDDLTEIDRKWMGRLLSVKKEEMFRGDEEEPIQLDNEPLEMEVDQLESNKRTEEDPSVLPLRLSRLEVQDAASSSLEEELPRVEVPRKVVKKVVCKKTVSFDLVPQIKYFEAPSRPKLTASEKGRLRFTRVIFNICNWNSHWLEECKRVAPDKDPPGVCEEKLRKIPKKFPCHSDYMLAFISPMLLNLWHKIKDKWVNYGESGFRQTLSCDSWEDYHAENLSVYRCTGLVQSVNAHKLLLREGQLVLLRLYQIQDPQLTNPASEKYSKKLGYVVFGFVEKKVYERYHNQPLHESLAERCGSIVGDLHIVKVDILVKKRPNFKLDKRKLVQVTVVQHIAQEIRMFKGICLLPDSPLCASILKPSKIELPPVERHNNKNLIFKGPMDNLQQDIVKRLSNGIYYSDSFVYSIHGAAGTGKGQVVLALILQLLYGEEWKGKRPKIIYCTQWSIPLDDMVLKLKSYRQALDEPFSLVRVGPLREVKPEVRDVSLTNLATHLKNSDKKTSDGRKLDAEVEVIKDADVICTTCISSGITKMSTAFEKILLKDRDRKVICIIDEAMSCREIETVIPLLLGVTHLILVGDIYQIEPTYSGERTHSLGLDMPLFWRIYKNFSNSPQELWPIYILKTQYRMNSCLSKCVSQIIYSTPLQKPSVPVSVKMGGLRSHLLVLDQTPDNVSKADRDNREVIIVQQLMMALYKVGKGALKNGAHLSIIACDPNQIQRLQLLLPKRDYTDLEIDHIHTFQGREFDIVIFLYDGRKIPASWLATALTRAKCCLLIVASKQSVNGNMLFRKVVDSAEKNNFLKPVHPKMPGKDFEQMLMAT